MAALSIRFWKELERWPWALDRYLYMASVRPDGVEARTLHAARVTRLDAVRAVATYAATRPEPMRAALRAVILTHTAPPAVLPDPDETQQVRAAYKLVNYDAFVLRPGADVDEYQSLLDLFRTSPPHTRTHA